MEGKENFIGLDYNTGRQRMELPEYGRNVMKMVEQLREIPDREKRTAQAKAVVKVMELLNPQVRQQEDYAHKLWDQLYIIAGFDLDVDAPFPIPEKAEFEKKPVPLPMKGEKIKAAHYGRNIEKIIEALQSHQIRLLKDSAMLDQLYNMNKEYFKELNLLKVLTTKIYPLIKLDTEFKILKRINHMV